MAMCGLLVTVVLAGAAGVEGLRCLVTAKNGSVVLESGCQFCALLHMKKQGSGSVPWKQHFCVGTFAQQYCTAPGNFWPYFTSFMETRLGGFNAKEDWSMVRAGCCVSDECTDFSSQMTGKKEAKLDCYEGILDEVSGRSKATVAGWSCFIFTLADGRFYATTALKPFLWRCAWPKIPYHGNIVPIYKYQPYQALFRQKIYDRLRFNATKLVSCCATDRCNVHPHAAALDAAATTASAYASASAAIIALLPLALLPLAFH